jgi:CBS domain-containing protein
MPQVALTRFREPAGSTAIDGGTGVAPRHASGTTPHTRRTEIMRVRDLMSQQVVTIEESESCQAAVARMHQARIRHLPVVDGGGAPVGVVTDRDLRHHLFAPGVYRQVGSVSVEILLKAVPVSAIMSTPVISVGPDADLMDAARVMLEDKIGSLPVVDGARVVGIVTETDLLRQICRADAACSPDIAEIVVSYP